MAKYTTEIRSICETYSGLSASEGQMKVNDIIANSRTKIFDFNYPIFDEEYKPVLESKILKHYYTREIGAETVGRWKLFLDTRMNEIMPYYNKLYESELLEFNPLYDVDYTRTGNRTGNEKGNETGETTSKLVDKMTGAVVDDGNTTDKELMTGTVVDDGSTKNEEKMTGTVKDVGSTSESSSNKEKITDDGGTTSKDTMTGTVKDNGKVESLRTDNLTANSEDGGKDSTSGSSTPKSDRWDYYSDTPQGSVGNLENLTYLTNARHIVEDGTGSTTNSEVTHGKTNKTTNTGTVKNEGTDENTKTYNTVNNITGTNENERNVTGTGEKEGTSQNTKTYDTVNTQNGTSKNTKTYDTDNDRKGTSTNTRTYDTTDTKDGNGTSKLDKIIDTTEDYLEHIVGKTAGHSYVQLLQEYRDSFLNIDMLIIRDLSDLFIGLWE